MLSIAHDSYLDGGQKNDYFKKRYDMLYNSAYHDNLTNCHNRNWYFENYGDDSEFLFVIVDINNLKTINDQIGHNGGDALIKEVADKLKTFGDTIRFGGDEFIVILPLDFDTNKLEDDRYSLGFCTKQKGMTLDDALDIADKKLYQNKIKKNVIKK